MHTNPNGSKVFVPEDIKVSGSVFIGPYVQLGRGIVLDGNINILGRVILEDRTFLHTQPYGVITISAYAKIGRHSTFSADNESTIFIGGRANLAYEQGGLVRLCASRGHDIYILGDAIVEKEAQVFADIASVELEGNACIKEKTQFFASLLNRRQSRNAYVVADTDVETEKPLLQHGSMRLVPRNVKV